MKFFLPLCLLLVVFTFAVTADNENLSECQRRRNKAIETTDVPLKIVFECEENGDFKGLQCVHDKEIQHCTCYTKDGFAITGMSRKLRHCKCQRERHYHENRHFYYDMPDCEPDGTYSKKQCNLLEKKCWCVDAEGTKISDATDDDC